MQCFTARQRSAFCIITRGLLAAVMLGIPAAQAQAPLVRDPLQSAAAVTGEADKKVTGGSFSERGWVATSTNSQIRIALSKPFGPKDKGAIELDITNFDPRNQYSGEKQQFFSFISRADGDPSPNDLWDAAGQTHCYALIRGGTNYIGYGGSSGIGFKSFTRSSGARSEIAHFRDKKDWSKTAVYTLKFTFDESKIQMYLSGERFRDGSFGGRKESLGYIFIGKDGWEGTSGSLVGPVFKELRIYGGGTTITINPPRQLSTALHATRLQTTLITPFRNGSVLWDLSGRHVQNPKALGRIQICRKDPSSAGLDEQIP